MNGAVFSTAARRAVPQQAGPDRATRRAAPDWETSRSMGNKRAARPSYRPVARKPLRTGPDRKPTGPEAETPYRPTDSRRMKRTGSVRSASNTGRYGPGRRTRRSRHTTGRRRARPSRSDAASGGFVRKRRSAARPPTAPAAGRPMRHATA